MRGYGILKSMTRNRAVLFVCCALLLMPFFSYAETDEERKIRLEAELQQIELDIEAKRGSLKEKQAQRTTLERDISILNTQIDKAKLSIKQRDLILSRLQGDIGQKSSNIKELDGKLDRSKSSLAQLIRRTNEIDDTTLVELALSGSISELFEDMDNYAVIGTSLASSFDTITTIRKDLAQRKQVLEEQQQEELELKQLQVIEKNKVEASKKQVDSILKVTKGQEKEYQKIIAQQEKSAAQIRAALFSLRDSKSISFGDAYRYAKEAEAITGTRAAVTLGVLTVESNLGQNVGKGNWKVDMHPTRDRPVFEKITAELGLNPDEMPVSKKAWYGWGGAMGPGQFIPSTWVLYKDRVGKLTGENPPNPWTARTAVYATSLLMSDNGADNGTRAAERLAALRYLAGWKNATKPAYAFYGDDVMEFADKYQKEIDILER